MSINGYKQNASLLIVSCDKYSDLWEVQVAAIEKFWPDCPMQIHLLTNELRPQIKSVDTIPVGADMAWSANLILALRLLKTEFVFLLLDDIILTRSVNTSKICTQIEALQRVGGNCLKLHGVPGLVWGKGGVGSIAIEPPGGAYRVSTVATVWRRSALLSLLKPKETAWQFEIDGSRRADSVEGFYFSEERSVYVLNAIIRGKWSVNALRKVTAKILPGYHPKRGLMSFTAESAYQLRLLFSAVWRIIPISYSRRIRDLVKGSASA
jgi:hypothetical protein